jgi:hypothetical protein
MMKRMGAKERFRLAKTAGKEDVMRDAAAQMLQGAWRGKVAKRRYEFFVLLSALE